MSNVWLRRRKYNGFVSGQLGEGLTEGIFVPTQGKYNEMEIQWKYNGNVMALFVVDKRKGLE